MKQPNLADYNLNEESRKLYEKQIAQYGEVQQIINAKKAERNKLITKINIISAIVSFGLFCLLSKTLATDSILNCILLILLFSGPVAIPCILSKLFHLEEYPLNDYEKRKHRDFEMSLPFHANKYYYVDKELEDNINRYDLAVKKYKQYLESKLS